MAPLFFQGCRHMAPPFSNPRMNPESICRHKLNVTAKLKLGLGRVENIMLKAFSPVPLMFFKGSLFLVEC